MVIGTEGFILRLARLFRVLRVAKLGRYTVAMQNIGHAIYSLQQLHLKYVHIYPCLLN